MSAAALALALGLLAPALSPERAAELVEDAWSEASAEPLEGRGVLGTAAAILAIAWHESGFRRSVERGRLRGDDGRSWCLMQIQAGRSPLSPLTVRGERHTAGKLATDRRLCFRAGLERLQQSERACSRVPGADPWSAYTTGRCVRNAAARARAATAARLVSESEP